MASSALTTIAEEIISLLHYLHDSPEWNEMINLQIWKRLKLLENDYTSPEVIFQKDFNIIIKIVCLMVDFITCIY